MPAYLQRLLDAAAAPRPGPVSLAPVVRSTSPVFEQDQLLGLEVHEPEQGLIDAPSPTPAQPRPGPAPASEISRLPGLPPGPPIAAGPEMAIPLSEPPAPIASPAFTTAEAITPTPPLSEPPAFATPALPVASIEVAAVNEPFTSREAFATATEPITTEPLRATTRSDPPTAPEVREARPARGVRLRLVDPPDLAEPALEPLQAEMAEAAEPLVEPAARIELSPRPRPEPIPEAPNPEPQAAPAAPTQPTITIGHVTVELIDEQKPPAAARPLTAASASVIGPLGQSRAAHRLLALRRL